MPEIESLNTSQTDADRFIERWAESGGSERANYQLFLAELCDLLEVNRPDPARPDHLENAYVFVAQSALYQ